MAPPRVSVIIIVYNGETYLAEAIDSVLAQTWPDYELLVVDDGSHDGSRELTQSYVDAHPDRVRLLRHPGGVNRGMSATRNLGLTHAKGELVELTASLWQEAGTATSPVGSHGRFEFASVPSGLTRLDLVADRDSAFRTTLFEI